MPTVKGLWLSDHAQHKISKLDRFWRVTRKVVNYNEDSPETSESEDFEAGLDFNNREDPDESIEGIRRRHSLENQVNSASEPLENSLLPEPTEDEPRNHFTPTRVQFPVNAPQFHPPATMTNFDQENGNDSAGAFKTAIDTVKGMTWDENAPGWFFNQFEIKLQTCGVKKQWTKLQTLSTILPKKVGEEIKQLLGRQETEWENNDSYYQVKTEILSIFGPSDDAAFERAMSSLVRKT